VKSTTSIAARCRGLQPCRRDRSERAQLWLEEHGVDDVMLLKVSASICQP
jgi:hypothetical protein